MAAVQAAIDTAKKATQAARESKAALAADKTQLEAFKSEQEEQAANLSPGC